MNFLIYPCVLPYDNVYFMQYCFCAIRPWNRKLYQICSICFLLMIYAILQFYSSLLEYLYIYLVIHCTYLCVNIRERLLIFASRVLSHQILFALLPYLLFIILFTCYASCSIIQMLFLKNSKKIYKTFLWLTCNLIRIIKIINICPPK